MTVTAETARSLVSEMVLELDSFRQRVPAGTFLLNDMAKHCLKTKRFDEAALHAADVLATLRGVPKGATELDDDSLQILVAMVLESAASTRMILAEMRSGSEEQQPEVIAAHEVLAVTLDNLADVLNHARAVYVVMKAEPSVALDEPTKERG